MKVALNHRLARLLPALTVLALGLSLAVATWLAVARSDEQAQAREQERQFTQISYEVSSRTTQALNVLSGLQGLFIASDEVTREDFHAYAQALEIERGMLGLQAVQFARLVTLAELPAFEARVRQDSSLVPGGYPDFRVAPPGQRPFYVVTEYNEPMQGNERAFGFDTADGPIRLAVLEAARDSGQARASAPFSLVQSAGAVGVAMRAPIYRHHRPVGTVEQRRDAYLGQVSVVFLVDRLLGLGLGNHLGPGTEVQLHDLGPVTEAQNPTGEGALLGRYGNLPQPSFWHTPFDTSQTLPVAGRFWEIRMRALPLSPYLQPKALTAGGLVMALTLLTLAVIGRMQAQRDHARALARALRENLTQSEARAAALIDATLTGIVTLDPRGVVRTANRAASELFGHGGVDLEGLPFSVLVPEVSVQALKVGTTHSIAGVTASGQPLPLAMSVGEVMSGNERLLLASFHDMSAQKRTEEQQRLFAEAMDATVRQRTAELTRANAELEAFAYTVAHDLRAPARHVEGFARVIEERHGNQLDASGHKYLQRILRAAAGMGQLIDDLLAFSQLGHGALPKQEVELEPLVQRCRDALEPEMEGRRVEWRVEPLPMVRADPDLLRQAVFNLLDNALKYTAGSDPAVIGVRADTTTPGEVRICISDNGVGFDMRYAHRLFKVFSRLHHADEFGGTGVGLASVQRILERHGGRVWAHGTPGQGAEFWFALPT
ncbi:MAG: CHASE domain-containing protein [Ramlibacter sp.]